MLAPRAPLQCFAPSGSGARGALGEPHGVNVPLALTRKGLGWAGLGTPLRNLVYLYTPNRVSRAQLRKIYCGRAES